MNPILQKIEKLVEECRRIERQVWIIKSDLAAHVAQIMR